MDRRDALKSLAAFAGSAGMTVAPLTVKDAEHVALVVFKSARYIDHATAERIKLVWEEGMKGTPLDGVKALVLGDGLDVEFVRK
jgi:hypothetical protein